MTRITRISMHGFKSFAKKTELEFTTGFNCVLGPNGSGKSNVIDSLCFVLGRGSSKSLRAEKSANLIYNGGKTKQPAKQGEVSIYFDNSKKVFPSPEKEVQVSRIVKSKGNSVYKINNKTHTRSEVLDFLAHARINPDGHNIILQGDIVRFTEMPTIERRKIIEEIAGIGVYEEKKTKAMRELEHVDQRLNDAELILKERDAYLRELKKERDQALRFKELQDKMDVNKASYLHIQIERLDTLHTKLNEKIEQEQKKIAEVEERTTELKQQLDVKKQAINDISKEIEEKGEKEQVTVHKEIEQLKVQLAKDTTKIETLSSDIEKIQQRKSILISENKATAGQLKDLQAERTALLKQRDQKLADQKQVEANLKSFRSKHGVDDATEIEKEIEGIEKESDGAQSEVAKIRQEQQDLLRRKDQVEYQLKTLDERMVKVQAIQSEHSNQLKDLKNRKELFKKSTLELNTALANDSSLAAQIGTARNKIQIANEQVVKAKAAAMTARDRVSANLAVKNILSGNRAGVYGTVAELGAVNSKYSMALEVAAGPKLQSIVVEDDKVARDCIMYLKKNRYGVATFLPLNKLKSPKVTEASRARGVHGRALDLVEYDSKFKTVFAYVFGDALVVDDIDVARRIGIGTAKMVTLDGDMADSTGAMRGGHLKKERGASFAAQGATQNLEKAEQQYQEQERLLSILQARRTENEDRIVSLRKQKGELEGEIIKTEKSLHLESGDMDGSVSLQGSLQKQLSEIDEELKTVQQAVSTHNRKLATITIEKQKLRQKISQLRNPRLVAELRTFEEKKSQLKEQEITIDAEIRNIDAKRQLLQSENEKVDEILKQHTKELEEFSNEVKRLKDTKKQAEGELHEKEIAAKKFYAKFKALFAQRSSLNDEIGKLDIKVETYRQSSRTFEISMNTNSLENARVSSELGGLRLQFEPFMGVKIVKRPEQELKAEIAKFERLVNTMGAVNMKALEIYDAVAKEYESLLQKKASLYKEKDDVLMMINEIEGKKTELFMKSFDTVNANFKQIFSSVTTKGEASLVVEDPTNPFEAGINIKVRLTGTRFLDIRGLSGGEKTLTALSFIFAIQEHQPHSFYVLDEVDAALDKHNSEKLSKLIRQYCEDAQYVVISHNDALITEADALYGVSMNEHGMTTVTSLKI